jgi:ABC-2 type transport system ATP-binding protein
MDAILEATSVTKHYERFSLRDVSLEVRRGSIAALFGPNGAGKSTLVKVLANQVPSQQGTVRVFGLSYVDRERDIKNRIGYVAQEPAFYAERSVQWTARFAAPFFTRWDGACFSRLLDEFKVNPLSRVKHLSGGQKRLLALALALSHGPELLILDEPTAGLDVVFRRALLDRLRAFVADGEKSVLVASHITDGLDEIAEDVSFLDAGRIVMHEDKDELVARWKRIHFRDGALAQAIVDRLLSVRRQPFGSSGLTSEFPALRDALASALAAGDVKIENASLEDILIFQVKGA